MPREILSILLDQHSQSKKDIPYIYSFIWVFHPAANMPAGPSASE